MTKPKTLDQLQAEKEQAETQLAQEQHKLERLENEEAAFTGADHHSYVRDIPIFPYCCRRI